MNQNLGGYSSGVPPLPIPNREVKPTRADGTALHRGRVGRRRFSREFIRKNRLSFFLPPTDFYRAKATFKNLSASNVKNKDYVFMLFCLKKGLDAEKKLTKSFVDSNKIRNFALAIVGVSLWLFSNEIGPIAQLVSST